MGIMICDLRFMIYIMSEKISERDVRIQKAQDLRQMGINPYAPKFKKLDRIDYLLENRKEKQELWLLRPIDDILLDTRREISLAGRLTLYRTHGKLSFWRLMDEHWEIQLMWHRDNCKLLKNRAPHKVNQEHHSIDATVKTWWRQVVKTVIIDDDGKIAIAYVATSNNYSLPGGWVDDGDDFYDTVRREALEETGCNVRIIADLPKVHEYLKKRNRHQMIYGFLCKTTWPKWDPEYIESEILDGTSIVWLELDECIAHIEQQIANPDNREDWSALDGIFKRDLILLKQAKELLENTKKNHDHEHYWTITEISDPVYDIQGNEITPYKLLEKYIDVGDIIGIKWELFTTHKGEPTIFVSEYQLLSKAIRPLGDKFHGIGEDNQETAYRQRYLDMIFNRESLERMKLRSKFVRTLRNFYDEQGFIELETPILGNSASGAAARPFITHHNDFDQEMYLRISLECPQKMATVGWLEKVFEIGKEFRNEWSDPSHIQEFTGCEHYAAYWNYEDNMRFTEQMFDYLFANIPQLSKKIQVVDKAWATKEVDFQTPWQRIDYIAQVLSDSGIDVSVYGPEDEQALRDLIKSKWFVWEGLDVQTTATMIDYLYKKVTRPKIVGPAFIYNYPKTMQPLARPSDADPKIVEQRQLLVNGWELIKAYSELVDPIQQQANFDEQADAVAKGDDEATKADDEFVLSMEYGMPPQSGWGMGIDRIFAMLTEQSNIRDVVLFPIMKPESQG